MLNIELIPAQEEDRAFFRDTHHLAYKDTISALFEWNEEKQDMYADADFNERNPHIITFHGERVGVIGWQDKEDHLWFGPIFIHPDHQGKGIGSILVKHFIDIATNQKKPLRLQTLRSNHGAKKLYERIGFKLTSESDIHWQMEYRNS